MQVKLILIFFFVFRITMTLDFAPSNRFFSWLDSAGGLQGNCLLRSRNTKKQCLLMLKTVKVCNCLQVSRRKFMYLNCVEWYEDLIVVKLKPDKNSVLNGIRTHDLCDTGAVLYQLSYQANWELVTLCVRNTLVDVFISFYPVEMFTWIMRISSLR